MTPIERLCRMMNDEALSWADVDNYIRAYVKLLRTRRTYAAGWRRKHRAMLSRKERARRRRRKAVSKEHLESRR